MEGETDCRQVIIIIIIYYHYYYYLHSEAAQLWGWSWGWPITSCCIIISSVLTDETSSPPSSPDQIPMLVLPRHFGNVCAICLHNRTRYVDMLRRVTLIFQIIYVFTTKVCPSQINGGRKSSNFYFPNIFTLKLDIKPVVIVSII